MNVLYADPVTLNEPFDLIIYDGYPQKKFFINCEDGKRRSMSGTLAGYPDLDRSNNCYLDFHVFLINPRAVMTLRITNLQSIYFDRLLGPKNYRAQSGVMAWRFDCKVTQDCNDFWVHFPDGKLKAQNVTK